MDPLDNLQNKAFQQAKVCHICEKQFSLEDKKVRDHCHFTGKYRGPAHESCNLNFQNEHNIPVVFHNLSAYDGHLIIKALARVEGTIDLLPVNKERYISFTKKIKDNLINFRFIDSFRFLASSLDKLASYLPEYPLIKSQFPDITDEKLKLLCRKGVMCYDYLSSWSKLKEERLPKKEHFYNQLDGTYISNKAYEHAKNVWKSFECKNLGEYSELYLKTDVMLLADVFEQFRKTSYHTYNLDVAHYLTIPGFTWDAMLYKTKQELELLTDIDMLLFIERGIRGGLSQCSKRYAEANNKYMPNYNSGEPSKYLMYYDINNQYGWSMCEPLPYGGFKWVENIENFDVTSVADDAEEGYVLEVDLLIPQNLHDKFADLPPCPEHKECKSKTKKLMVTLYNKEKYVIHYRNLKQAMSLGVKLTHIHRVLAFKQSAWLKPYIDLNTQLRSKAKNEFEKNLFKLLNNAIFGKSMESVRKYSSVKLRSKWEGRYGAEALLASPLFKSITIFDENLVAIEMANTNVYFNKPIYVGMCILDISKTTIYDFHYNYMKREFEDKCNVLYTDTDSLIYEISIDDIYPIIKRDANLHFDTSDYPENNIYQIPQVNKKVIGMLKDENNGTIMTHFVGLRSKMYAIKVLSSESETKNYRTDIEREGRNESEVDILISNMGITKKIKGIKRNIVKNEIKFEDFVECLENRCEKSVVQKTIKSEKHELYSVKQTKIALSPHDDKRYILQNTYCTLPWGHYSIIEQ